MKKYISYLLLLTFIFTAFSFNYSYADTYSEYENNEAFVMYKDGSFNVIKYESKNELAKGINKLKTEESVLLVQPNYTYSTSGISLNDEFINKQWALYNDGSFYMEENNNQFPVFDEFFDKMWLPGQWTMPDFFGIPGGSFFGFSSKLKPQTVTAVNGIDINYNEAISTYNGGVRDVVVAIIDTGVDYTHEELKNSIWINEDEIADNGIDDDQNGFIDDYYGWNFYNNSNKIYSDSNDDHGTHGAGTIIAKSDNEKGIAGVADSEHIKVMSVKALGGFSGSGSTDSIIKAINYAEKNGALICNLSLGTYTHDEALYQTMKNSNMLFVVAAGNNGKDIDKSLSYPASYDIENMITVANINYSGSLDYSSNYGAENVDLAAPGSYILSTTTNNTYSYMTGTSMSAPFVSAAAALIYTHFNDITLCNVKEIILNSVTPLEGLKGITKSGGMLNLGKALKYDLSSLSQNTWEVKTNYVNPGKAPVILPSIINSQGKTYLYVQFIDEDNDLSIALYKEGSLEAKDFNKGTDGEKVTLNTNNSVTYSATPGIYTFYAIDSMGNEAVKAVEIKEPTPVKAPDNKNYNNRDYFYKQPTNPDNFIEDLFNNIFGKFFNNFGW